MLEQVDRVLREAMNQIVVLTAGFLPGVLVSLVLVLATFVVAAFVRMMLMRGLRGLEFDRWAEQAGVSGLVGWSSSASPTTAVARSAYWIIVVLGLLVSLTALNATMPSRLAFSVFEYVPHLLAALMILVIGAVAARFLARSVLIEAVNMQIQSARLLSLVVKWLVLMVAVAMALDHLGIGRSVLLLAFGITFGGVVFAAALAVGLAARDVVGRAIERQLREPPGGDDRVNHV
jgi:hypothetical protein